MAKFGKTSKQRLKTCDQDIQIIFNHVIKYFDCTVICGNRSKDEQEEAFNKGFSKVRFPNSKHNSYPSMAVDVVPYPVDWHNLNRMKYFAGYVMGIAKILKEQGKITHDLITGLDWNDNTILKDTTFVDHPHYQLK